MDFVEEVKSRTDIVDLLAGYLTLKKAGRNYKACCPFHHEKTPSFMISPERQFGWCFGCQQGGDVITLVEKLEGVGFREAVKLLAEKAGVPIPADFGGGTSSDVKDRLVEINERALSFFAAALKKDEAAADYLTKRGLSDEIITRFRIGYAPDRFDALWPTLVEQGFTRKELIDAGVAKLREMGGDDLFDAFRGRIVFPIADARGQAVAFTGRVMGDGQPKYLNSAESPIFKKNAILFGLHLARETIREKKQAVVVEGQMDVIACHQAGFTQVVASSGTALTEQHLRALSHLADEVLLCMDADDAGKESTRRALMTALTLDLTVRVVVLPSGYKDPDETIQKDPALFQQALDGALPAFSACADYLFKDLPRETATDKKKLARQFLEVAQHFASAIEREDFLKQTALFLGVSETALADELARLPAAFRAEAVQTATADDDAKSATTAASISSDDLLLGLLLAYPELREITDDWSPASDADHALFTESDVDATTKIRGEKLRLLAFEKYDDFSSQKRAEEVRGLIARLGTKSRDEKLRELKNAMAAAEAAGDDARAAELFAEYQKLLKK